MKGRKEGGKKGGREKEGGKKGVSNIILSLSLVQCWNRKGGDGHS